MSYQYVVAKDEETEKVDLIGRFKDGIDEMWVGGRWESNGFLYGLQRDGLLERISEAEAMKLIEEMESRQLQVA
jgi:hypothetical protein